MEPLYEDIYIMIYKNLNLEGKLRLAQTCTLLENIFVEHFCSKLSPDLDTETFTEISKFCDDDLEFFWRHYGARFKSIEIITTSIDNRININYSTAMRNALDQYCTHLKTIKIWGITRIDFSVFLNATNLSTITEVDLNCFRILDDQLELLTRMPNLKVLALWHSAITGKHIDRMRQIKFLTFRYCYDITMENMLKICKNLELRYLDIRSSYFENLDAVIQHCGEIEELRYSWNTCNDSWNIENEAVTALPKLKSLMICMREWDPIPENYFRSLAHHHRNDLQAFRICVYIPGQIANAYKLYLEKFNYLQNLFDKYFYEDCENLTFEFYAGYNVDH